MSHRKYKKQAQQLGILLALANDNPHLRAVAFHVIGETMAELKKKSLIFSGHLFAKEIARTVFPADPQREAELLSTLIETERKTERVA